MKIFIAHNRYQQAGGEDNVVEAETNLLRNNGHQVYLWAVDNKDLPGGFKGKVETALNTTYSPRSKLRARDLFREFRPDVVHVHNFVPQISPSIFDACRDESVPVVQTLHNYRLICPGAMLMRNGSICEKCITGSPYNGAWHSCYRGSRLGSLVVAHMVAYHRNAGTWADKIDRFVALTEFAKSKFVEGGFPSDRIAVKPNFIVDPLANEGIARNQTDQFGLFVGRISEEKGIATLLNAWASLEGKWSLKVAGSGPLETLLRARAGVESLGRQNSAEISNLMRNAHFLVLPSEWYEGFPLVLVEAFAHGLPVLASKLGSMADVIEDGVTGLLFDPGNSDDMAQKARWLFENPEQSRLFGENARRRYLEKYTAEINYEQLMKIYRSVC